MEVETGVAAGPAARRGAPSRASTRRARRSLRADQAKAAELGVSLRTVQPRRARYAQQGLWGLVDQRAVRA